jgi:ribosomal-protein-alanine N-acetyltransferase
MKILLETERLYFREFTMDDAEMLFEMHQDHEITRYVGDVVPWDTLELTQKILREFILPQYENKIGRWAVYVKENNVFIGWCGLKKVDDEYDLGYRFIQKYWGRGYATEAAAAVLTYGVELGLEHIMGRAAVANVASVNVLKKIGMTFEKFYVDEEAMGESVKYIVDSTYKPS